MVDPLTFTALLGILAGGTVFLNALITMNILVKMVGKKRKRRAITVWDKIQDVFQEGN